MPVFEVNSDTKSRKAVAVRFSNGALNSKDQSRVTFKCYTQNEAGSKTTPKTSSARHIVTAEVDGMTYVGKTFGPTNRFPTEDCDYYFGVHDEKTGKIKVISAALCQLEPLIEDTRAVEDADHSKKTFREKYDALAKDFGSGRSQRAVNKRINNKMDDEMVSMTTKAVVESRHTQQQAAASSESIKTETSAVPPHNKDAASPDEVYKLKDIITPEVMESIAQKSDVFFKCTLEDVTKWRTEKQYYSFVLDKLDALSLREDARKLQSHCLMYLQFLMNVFLMKAKDLGKKYEHQKDRLKWEFISNNMDGRQGQHTVGGQFDSSTTTGDELGEDQENNLLLTCQVPLPTDWPVPMKNHILQTFTLEISQAGKRYQRCVPGRLRDLLLSHILVLCLKLSQFDLVLTPLMVDLNLSHKRITTHATILGCTIKKVKGPDGQDIHKAVLNVPLKFPELKARRAKNAIF